MNLKEYVNHLQNLLESVPESAKYEVIYSGDDEGNWFQSVEFVPNTESFCVFESGEMIFYGPEDDLEEYELTKKDYNAIVIN